LSNENKEQKIETVNDLQTIVDMTTGADIDINEFKISKVEKTELERIIEEKCTKIITTIICEGDIVGVNSGRYWVEGKVVRVSRFGISIQNPTKEFVVRLGKINIITIHQRGKIYNKYKDAINEFFKNT